MASDLKDFIRVYDDVLASNLCKNAIKSFEDNAEAHDRWENQFKPQFTQLNVTLLAEKENNKAWGVIQNELIAKIQSVSELYMKDTACSPFLSLIHI